MRTSEERLFAVWDLTKAVVRISGANFLEAVWDVALPIARRGIGAGIALSFVHTIGLIRRRAQASWSNSGVTRIASSGLYDEGQKLKLLRRTFDLRSASLYLSL